MAWLFVGKLYEHDRTWTVVPRLINATIASITEIAHIFERVVA